jgi:hypothetical protein
MSKPDWNDAPEWAQWMAQDKGGEWYWYEHKPKLMHARHEVDYSVRSESRCQLAREIPGWDKTVERRP